MIGQTQYPHFTEICTPNAEFHNVFAYKHKLIALTCKYRDGTIFIEFGEVYVFDEQLTFAFAKLKWLRTAGGPIRVTNVYFLDEQSIYVKDSMGCVYGVNLCTQQLSLLEESFEHFCSHQSKYIAFSQVCIGTSNKSTAKKSTKKGACLDVSDILNQRMQNRIAMGKLIKKSVAGKSVPKLSACQSNISMVTNKKTAHVEIVVTPDRAI